MILIWNMPNTSKYQCCILLSFHFLLNMVGYVQSSFYNIDQVKFDFWNLLGAHINYGIGHETYTSALKG